MVNSTIFKEKNTFGSLKLPKCAGSNDKGASREYGLRAEASPLS